MIKKLLAGIGVLAILLVGGCAALFVFAAGEAAETIEAGSTAVMEAASITSCETDDFGFGKARVELENPLDERKGHIQVEVVMYDADGVQIGSGWASAQELEPGAKAVDELTVGLPEGSTVDSCKIVDGTAL